MATVQIADNDARVQYTQAVNGLDNDPTPAASQLTIDFPFFDVDEINVIRTDSSGNDTTLSRGTGSDTFTVTGTSVDDGFSGGYVEVHDTNSDTSTTYTIFRDIAIERTTDFPTSGPFNINALNTELDKAFAIKQELETQLSRTIRLTDSDTSTALSLVLPKAADRSGKFLSFDADGAPIVTTNAGDYKGAWSAGVVYNIGDTVTDTTTNNVYRISAIHTSAGVLPLSTNVNSGLYTLFIDVATIQTSLIESVAADTATALAIALG